MPSDIELNRMEFLILESLYKNGCTDKFHGMSIAEIMNSSSNISKTKMTVYRKMKKLTKAGYVNIGCLDNHAETFYLQPLSEKLFERR